MVEEFDGAVMAVLDDENGLFVEDVPPNGLVEGFDCAVFVEESVLDDGLLVEDSPPNGLVEEFDGAVFAEESALDEEKRA